MAKQMSIAGFLKGPSAVSEIERALEPGARENHRGLNKKSF